MQTNKLSTCAFLEADVALFPLVEKPIFDYEHILPHGVREKVIGVADLLPIVANRLSFFYQHGKTFAPKNIPLCFSVFDNLHSNEMPVAEFWNQIMLAAQRPPRPHIWVIAPQSVCELIMNEHVRGEGMFYYHNPAEVTKSHYYAITKSSKQVKTHFLLSGKN